MLKHKSVYVSFLSLYCWLEKKKIKILSRFLYMINRVLFSNDIPPTVQFGENLKLPHFGLGIVMHPRTIIGNNVTIYQNVTLGCRNKEGPPIIKDNCLIGAGACVLGDIILEENVSVGSNAVVVKNVKKGKTVVGIPAYEINKEGKNDNKDD